MQHFFAAKLHGVTSTSEMFHHSLVENECKCRTNWDTMVEYCKVFVIQYPDIEIMGCFKKNQNHLINPTENKLIFYSYKI